MTSVEKCVLLFLIVFILSVGFVFGLLVAREYWERDCVKHGAAHYDSQTGKWQWNDTPLEKP